MPGIFISYRREDSIAHAGRLYDRLSAHFGSERVFMDIDTIDLGVDFVVALQESVASCDVLIAVIGRQWLDVKDEEGQRRLDNPEDFVRIEIGAALDRDVRVIPVLVGGSRMPRSIDLPSPIAKLARRNALDIPDLHFSQSVGRLIVSLEKVLTESEQYRLSQEEARAEVEERRRDQEERARTEAEARRREQEERARAEAEAGRRDQEERARAEAEARRREQEQRARAEAEARRRPQEEEKPAEVQELPSPEPQRSCAEDEERWKSAVAKTLLPNRTRGFYVAPDIPVSVAVAARESCAVPESESVIGVLDCSGIGTARLAIVFGARGLYYETEMQRGSVEYLTLPDGKDEVTISGGALSFRAAGIDMKISLRGSSMSAGILRALLVQIKGELRDLVLRNAAAAGQSQVDPASP
jgi:hypothetical protein